MKSIELRVRGFQVRPNSNSHVTVLELLCSLSLRCGKVRQAYQLRSEKA